MQTLRRKNKYITRKCSNIFQKNQPVMRAHVGSRKFSGHVRGYKHLVDGARRIFHENSACD